MFNIRINIIAGGLAFFLSLLIGIISQSSFPTIILRPLIFAGLFFGLATLITLLINRFLPELLEEGELERPDIEMPGMPGSKIDIREDDSAAMPGGLYARPDESEEGIGDISNIGNFTSSQGQEASEPRSGGGLFESGPLAQEYTAPESAAQGTEVKGFELPGISAPGAMSPGAFGANDGEGLDQEEQSGYTLLGQGNSSETSGGFDVLPDLESLAGAFSSGSGGNEPEEEAQEFDSSDGPARTPVGNKSQQLEGDFTPKELAAGVRTVLTKQEG